MPQSILIIEDDKAVSASMALGLTDAGFAVLEAAEASAAMRIFLHEAPDLVLLDLGIGGEGGMVLLRNMKKVRPATPVIIVSGRTHISNAIEAFKAGAWDYVTKPIASLGVFINSLRNCLAQTRLQQRVQDTQEHLFRLVQNLPVIIFIINRNLEFEFLNQTTQPILGFAPQEILESPRPFLRRVIPEDRKRFVRAIRKSLRHNAEGFRLEFRFRHKKGYTVTLEAQSIVPPLAPGATPDRVEGMIADVTRNSFLDKILRQNEKLNMLRTMTEEVAHEIRNPLVSLGGFARKLHTRFPEAVETGVILEECGRLERLVQRIGAYLEPIDVQLTRCRLPATLAFVMNLLGGRLDRKGVTPVIDVGDGLPPVLADQEFLHRIFIYLVGHGADILEQSGDMRIRASAANGLVRVTLRMEPVKPATQSRDSLIMPFEDDERNLAMCYRLMERIGGHLHLGREGSAALITASFPRHPRPDEAGEPD
jgi:PAS domain S-box-containing protein